MNQVEPRMEHVSDRTCEVPGCEAPAAAHVEVAELAGGARWLCQPHYDHMNQDPEGFAALFAGS